MGRDLCKPTKIVKMGLYYELKYLGYKWTRFFKSASKIYLRLKKMGRDPWIIKYWFFIGKKSRFLEINKVNLEIEN